MYTYQIWYTCSFDLACRETDPATIFLLQSVVMTKISCHFSELMRLSPHTTTQVMYILALPICDSYARFFIVQSTASSSVLFNHHILRLHFLFGVIIIELRSDLYNLNLCPSNGDIIFVLAARYEQRSCILSKIRQYASFINMFLTTQSSCMLPVRLFLPSFLTVLMDKNLRKSVLHHTSHMASVGLPQHLFQQIVL